MTILLFIGIYVLVLITEVGLCLIFNAVSDDCDTIIAGTVAINSIAITGLIMGLIDIMERSNLI